MSNSEASTPSAPSTTTPPTPASSNAAPAAQPATPSDYKVFRPPRTSENPEGSQSMPDAFFQPTTLDLQYAQATLTARTQALTNAPLRTQAMRDAEMKAKLAKYPTVTIRVRFSDRTQLEKKFPSTDKIRSVYAFVRGSLREDVKPIKFILFQTPPPRELKVSDPKVRDKNLLQLQLAPSTVLHLKFEDESLNHVTVSAPLATEVLAKAEDLPVPPNYDAQPSSSGSSSGGRTLGSKPGAGGSTKSSGKTVPKWLKLGK